MFKSKNSALLLIFSSIFLAAFLAEAQTPPNSAITGVAMQGSGCEESSAQAILSPDAKDLSILFDNYSAEIGQGSLHPSLLRAQKDCRVFVDFHVPRGWQFAFRSLDYRGFVAIPASAWAFHRLSFIAPNQPIASLKEASLSGAQNRDYAVRVEQRPERMIWSPCGGQQRLQFFSQLAVQYYPRSTDRSIAQISLDSVDGSFRQSFSVEWRQCAINGGGSGGGPKPPGPIRPIRPRY